MYQMLTTILSRRKSGLPYFDLLLLDKIPNSQALPLATVLKAKEKIQNQDRNKKWYFDYIFFTESDQVLVMRNSRIDHIYSFLDKYPRRVLIPHRLIPYPEEMFITQLHRPIAPDTPDINRWQNMVCGRIRIST
jgi:hypothetical protein